MTATVPALRRVGLVAVAVLLGLAIGGCTSMVDRIPTSLGGLPEGVPPRQPDSQPYPAVHDMPPRRDNSALSDPESKVLREDLKATRSKAAAPLPIVDSPATTAGGARNP